MGSRNAEGVGGVLGLKATTPIYKVVNHQKELDKRVISADDFTKAKNLITIPEKDEAIYQQAHPAMKIAMQKVMVPYVSAQIQAIYDGETSEKFSDWKFKVTPGKDKLEYRITFYAPESKKPNGTLTLKIGTKEIEGKKQYAVMVKTPSGKWQTFTGTTPGLKISSEDAFSWLGDVGGEK